MSARVRIAIGFAAACFASTLVAQQVVAALQPKGVSGTVRDTNGAPIAGARVRLAVPSLPPMPGLLTAELARDPLPSTRSSRAGTWSFVLAAPHQRFSPTLHGALALVVEADGFQPWREALPSPASSWDGSDVVLQPRTAADDAVVVVSGAPDGAIVRLRRLGDLDTVFRGGRPAGEVYDFAVPAGGKLTVNVPLLPSPLVPRPEQPYDQLGWGVQLLAPGRTTGEQPIVAGQTVTLAAAAPARAVAATRADGTAVPVARVLAALSDGTLRWYAAPGGEVPEDALLPVVAIETGVEPENGLVLPWPGHVPAPPPAALRSLRFVDGNGQPVGDASGWWFAPDELARTPRGARVRG